MFQLDAALPAEVDALLPHDEVVVAVISLLERMIVGTVITIVETVVIALVAQMTGEHCKCGWPCMYSFEMFRDRDLKDDRDEGRENGTNGEDRKGEFTLPRRAKIPIN